jgi:DNA-binding NarL/FixJ family response regulator
VDVWIYAQSRVVAEAFSHLVTGFGFHPLTCPQPPAEADVALWAPSRIRTPLPAPPAVPTLVVTEASDNVLVELLQRGYRGFLRPDDGGEKLKVALEAVCRGEVWARRDLMSRALTGYAGSHDDKPAPTPREVDVLTLLVKGFPNRVIGERLGISERTVKSHVSSLLAKYRVTSRVELVVSVLHDFQDVSRATSS